MRGWTPAHVAAIRGHWLCIPVGYLTNTPSAVSINMSEASRSKINVGILISMQTATRKSQHSQEYKDPWRLIRDPDR